MTDPQDGPIVQICQPDEVAAASRAYGLAVVSGDPDDPYHHKDCGGCGGQRTSDDCPYSVRIRAYADSLPWNQPDWKEPAS